MTLLAALGRRSGSRAALSGLAMAFLAMATTAFATFSFAALAPFLRGTFALSTIEVGGLTSLIYVGGATASVPAGRLTDRLGAARTLVFAQAILVSGLVVVATAEASAVLLVGIGICGLAYAAVNPATNVLATAAISPGRRGLFMGIKQTGLTLGGLISGLALPAMAGAASWRVALALPAAGALLTAACASWTARREAADWFRHRAGEGSDPHDRAVALPGPLARGIYGFVMSGAQIGFVSYLTIYLVDHEGFSSAGAGAALSVVFGAACAGRIFWGAVSDRAFRSHVPALLMATGGLLGGLALVASGAGAGTLWAGMLLIGFCGMSWNGTFFALVADATCGRNLGRATGQTVVFMNGGIVLLPLGFGAVHDAVVSWPLTWAVAAGTVLLAGAALTAGTLRARRLMLEQEPFALWRGDGA